MTFSRCPAYTALNRKIMFRPRTQDRVDEGSQLHDLRISIQANKVIFPVPVPVFRHEYRADVQWRLAELYLIHGWSPTQLAQRYQISPSRVRQSVRRWVQCARQMGYLQSVPPENEYWPRIPRARQTALEATALTYPPPQAANPLTLAPPATQARP